MKYVLWIIFGCISLIFLRILLGDATSTPLSIKKDLHLTLKNDTPCFYIDTFEGITNFDINYFGIRKMDSEFDWRKKIHMWEDEMNYNRAMSLSSIAGKNQCLLYGIKNRSTSSSAKKLQMNVIYEVTMEGKKRNISKHELKNGDTLFLRELFYLSKNPKTGKTEILLPTQTQVTEWVKKMNEQDQSNQTKKGEK